MRKFSMILFAVGMMTAGLAFGQGNDRLVKLNVSGYFDSASKYVRRGLPIVDTGVYQTAVDLSIMNVGPGHLGLGWWGNYTLGDIGSPLNYGPRKRLNPLPAGTPGAEYMTTGPLRGSGLYGDGWDSYEYTEHRFKAGYALLLPGDSMLEFGFIDYKYPNDGTDDTDTTEIYAKFKARLALPSDAIEAYFTTHVYYDTDQAEGWYVTPGLMTEMKVANNWKAFFNVNLGYANEDYNQYYFNEKANTFNDVTAELGIGAPIDGNISVKVAIGASEMIDSDIENELDRDPQLSSGNGWLKIGIHGKF